MSAPYDDRDASHYVYAETYETNKLLDRHNFILQISDFFRFLEIRLCL